MAISETTGQGWRAIPIPIPITLAPTTGEDNHRTATLN